MTVNLTAANRTQELNGNVDENYCILHHLGNIHLYNENWNILNINWLAEFLNKQKNHLNHDGGLVPDLPPFLIRKLSALQQTACYSSQSMI